MRYTRVLLKISGEALKGPAVPLDTAKLDYVTDEIIALYKKGIEVAVVVGGGNISRGSLGEKWGISPVDSDINGMLATIVNAGWISSIIEAKEPESVRKMVSISSSYCGEMYSPAKAKSYLKAGKIVVIGGGNGIALSTTDSAAIQRAVELSADCVIMLKNGVDGIYTSDPRKNKDAKRYVSINFEDFKKMSAGVMDETAAIIAEKYELPMHVVDFSQHGLLGEICEGEKDVGTYVGDCETRLYWVKNKSGKCFSTLVF